MGKQGPCCHCGVTNTPLWRNGPPEKPVLCNACGSRWRTKGSLANYTPLHARAGADDYEDHRVFKAKSMSVNKFKEIRTPKRKQIQESMIFKRASFSDFSQDMKKFDEDTSNRSSSGSAISNSESCSQFASADGSDLTGPTQSNVWETMVPSKKRTCVGRPKPSPVEKLTKDLFNILQEQQSSFFSCSSEEDLLFESETPMVSMEIGHGSVLIRHPHSSTREEESEASSLSIDNKNSNNESYSHSMKLTKKFDTESLGFDFDGTDKARQRVEQEKHKRNKSHNEKQQMFGGYISPFCSTDLKDIFNYEEFVGQFTTEEQLKLMKFLPQLDSSNSPDSLKVMFDSPQFRENVSFFQQLLAEGVFDKSFSSKQEDGKALVKVALSDMRKSHLVESFYQHKKCKEGDQDSEPRTSISNSLRNLMPTKRSYESQNQNFSEARAMMRSPKRVMLMKPIYEDKESTMDHNASCFSPRSLLSFSPDGSSPVMLGYDDSNQDLLLDVPSNGSFPQAELLRQF